MAHYIERRSSMTTKRLKKSCTGCGDYFTCYQQANYDYCRSCAINGSRYAQNQCLECGDGSGIIKFPHQKLRACKTCALVKPKLSRQRSQKKCFVCSDYFITY